MNFKPILFNTEMVKAILEGRKTQTRRIVKGLDGLNVYRAEPSEESYESLDEWDFFYGGSLVGGGMYDAIQSVKAPCAIGDILWVRETWYKDARRYMYRANYSKYEKFYQNGKEVKLRWHPSIHMTKEAARIFLRVKDVRVKKLNDILAHADEVAKEGIPYSDEWDIEASGLRFKELWDSTINPADRDKYGWDANPWVWVIEFERCEEPEGWNK